MGLRVIGEASRDGFPVESMSFRGLGYRVYGLGFTAQSLAFRAWGLGLMGDFQKVLPRHHICRLVRNFQSCCCA